MKYVKPDLDIIEFEEDVITSTQVGPSGNSTENNGNYTDIPEDMWG